MEYWTVVSLQGDGGSERADLLTAGDPTTATDYNSSPVTSRQRVASWTRYRVDGMGCWWVSGGGAGSGWVTAGQQYMPRRLRPTIHLSVLSNSRLVRSTTYSVDGWITGECLVVVAVDRLTV